MKMVMISYNSVIDSEVMEILKKCGIESYTKWTQVQGKGKTSGPHFGTDIWPGENSVIFTAIEYGKTENFLKHIRELKAKLGKEGIKAFFWDLEGFT